MYNNHQSATGQQQHFGGPRGPRSCGGFGGKFGQKFGGKAPWIKHFGSLMGNRPAVNIEESDAAYTLHVYAAGLAKENFTLSVKDGVLTVGYKAPESTEKEGQFSYREYNSGSFERLFQISDQVLTDQISAAYAEGILKVTLPKDPEKATPAHEVKVS